nr:immunoglobulin heavy chain junction region [Macaca mulatta]MOV48888.1 immunoglobulin heavy chain junction region [Macaca mulatta]MOV49388.1 immunoglobulin heavy chain junction region [Macaca mulatta]MOV50090.1 immunoglobulin heavy chain junction region [Macaca mulatta]MOV50355.1 immunoglobulin heavy chain junction region [Macaca mulatta]
CMSDYW